MAGDEALKPSAMIAKAKKLASWLAESKHAVVYTGAGISTAAGIPDYRGPQGVWALRAKGLALPEPNFFQVEPTISHHVIASLVHKSLVKHVVTQNIDGLHLKAGVPDDCLSELHGNFCLEVCSSCDTKYYRSYPVWNGLTSYVVPSAFMPTSISSSDLETSPPQSPSTSVVPPQAFSSDHASQQKKRRILPSGSEACSPQGPHPQHHLSADGFLLRSCRQKQEAVMAASKSLKTSEGSWQLKRQASSTSLASTMSSCQPSKQQLGPLSSSGFDNCQQDGVAPSCATPLETGRTCDRHDCRARLHRSVVLFGESLAEKALDDSDDNSNAADLAIVLGSSLSVGPACELPAGVARRGGRLVIINLQPTQYDKRASMVVREKCDEMMALVAAELQLSMSRPGLQNTSPSWPSPCVKEKAPSSSLVIVPGSSRPLRKNVTKEVTCDEFPGSSEHQPLPQQFSDPRTPPLQAGHLGNHRDPAFSPEDTRTWKNVRIPHGPRRRQGAVEACDVRSELRCLSETERECTEKGMEGTARRRRSVSADVVMCCDSASVGRLSGEDPSPEGDAAMELEILSVVRKQGLDCQAPFGQGGFTWAQRGRRLSRRGSRRTHVHDVPFRNIMNDIAEGCEEESGGNGTCRFSDTGAGDGYVSSATQDLEDSEDSFSDSGLPRSGSRSASETEGSEAEGDTGSDSEDEDPEWDTDEE